MLDKYYDKAIEDAVNSLKDNGVIVLPTDTVYGLACLASSKEAIDRIYQIKNRSSNKLLPVVVNSYKMLMSVSNVDLELVKKLSNYFPGGLTIVCKKNPSFDYYDSDTIAIRMVETPLVNKIIESVNEPLALTSANISNEGDITNPLDLLEIFDGVVDCVFIDGKVKGVASTIVEILSDGSLKLIREGKIPFEKIVKEYNND